MRSLASVQKRLLAMMLVVLGCNGTSGPPSPRDPETPRGNGRDDGRAQQELAAPAPSHGSQPTAFGPSMEASEAGRAAGGPVPSLGTRDPTSNPATLATQPTGPKYPPWGSQPATLAELEAALEEVEGASASSLMERHPVAFETELGYEPREAQNLELIQKAGFRLHDDEMAKLSEQGFVILPYYAFPNMAYGYRDIYRLDLPVYISLDAILETVHLSYDAVLEAVEKGALIGELEALLMGARGRLSMLEASGEFEQEVTADLALYLDVGISLLRASQPPQEGKVAEWVDLALTAEGIREVTLFGRSRMVDFSQFQPRGHYLGDQALEDYFRTMVWLGRTDFRLIETMPDGSRVFNRRQFDAVRALHDLVQGDARAAYDGIDAVVTAFVGDPDYMTLAQVDALLLDLEEEDAEPALLEDRIIETAIVEGGYGAQRIASQVKVRAKDAPPGPLPLDRSFALLGQRYAVDSHVLSEVVYDRVPQGSNGIKRRLPDPLDAAYAALGNDAALPLLADELTTYEYAPQLERARILVDAHGMEAFRSSLYTDWLSILRALSPAEWMPNAEDLPSVTRTEAWSTRLLNTQLASWAELRHDTILYVKQSYTSGSECEYPDGYVDPYPAAYAALARFGSRGVGIMDLLEERVDPALTSRIRAYFEEVVRVAVALQGMAEHQRTGMPFDAQQMAFLNDAVDSHSGGCGAPDTITGWYARLLFDRTVEDMKPVVADVHTAPPLGTAPGLVLHVATGWPRLLVVTRDSCDGPRAYAGLASAYHEVVTGLDRLTDREWEPMSLDAPLEPWMTPILP
ncbi:MAG: DUF3160 domain-containing protein [Myxococcales bacterium]|nr:DUF3160 domain-containing protein [Myxococcales bacterium]